MNDKYVIMYCGDCIFTANTLTEALQIIEDCKNNDFYKKSNECFDVYIKIDL